MISASLSARFLCCGVCGCTPSCPIPVTQMANSFACPGEHAGLKMCHFPRNLPSSGCRSTPFVKTQSVGKHHKNQSASTCGILESMRISLALNPLPPNHPRSKTAEQFGLSFPSVLGRPHPLQSPDATPVSNIAVIMPAHERDDSSRLTNAAAK